MSEQSTWPLLTWDEAAQKLHNGKTLEIAISLGKNGGIFARHTLHLNKRGFIVDHSSVDNSTNSSSVPDYRSGFYGKAFKKNAVRLIEETQPK